MTEQEIHAICKKYNIQNYSINLDGSIDVDGNVVISDIVLGNVKSPNIIEKIPLKFNKVNRSFYCNHNELTSLYDCPKEVGGYFDCCYNKLTSLEGSPIKVGGRFLCFSNELTSLEGYNGNYTNLLCGNKKKLVEIDIIDRKKKNRKQKLKILEKL